MIYIVQENGELYPVAYSSYMQALHAVKRKHKVYIEDAIREARCLESIESFLSIINVLENTLTGTTRPFIHNGLDVVISRLELKPADF